MLIAKLTISFDRGIVSNKPDDVGLAKDVQTTPTGGIVRGLGTHYVSEEAKERAEECEAAERAVRTAFNRTFAGTPFAGAYIVPSRAEANALLSNTGIDPRISVRLSFFDLNPSGPLPQGEVDEWVKRIRNQLEAAPLGRAEEAGAAGLAVVERLAECPIIEKGTRDALLALVHDAKLEKVKRLDFKRRISELKIDLKVGPVQAPRRVRAVKPSPAAAESVA